MYLHPAIVSDWMAVRDADVRRRSVRFRPWVLARSSRIRPVPLASEEWARPARYRRQRSPSAAC